MKKTLFFFAAAAMSLVACNKVETSVVTPSGELSVIPINADAAPSTRGYVEGTEFIETTYETLHGSKTPLDRTMQISAYLHPQDGAERNYFENKTYKKDGTIWRNHNGSAYDPIYWPVGGKLDFLAYSVSAEPSGLGSSKNIDAVWNSTNAASEVVLTVPAENTQNDILFAGANGIQARQDKGEVPMKFKHSQAWLEFILTGSTDATYTDGIVTLKRIELIHAYNAGTLTVNNNGGDVIADWDFTGVEKKDIEVDNFTSVKKLNGAPQYLDMLIPQQDKCEFVIYYTLGNDTKEYSYSFKVGPDTWLMGEKYIYNINITTTEVTVDPKVTPWNEKTIFNYTVKLNTAPSNGTVDPTFSPKDLTLVSDESGLKTYTCDTWGAQVTLTAEPKDGYCFVKWSDDVTENPRTFTITGSTDLPVAEFVEGVKIKVAPSEFGAVSINSQAVDSLWVIPGSEVELKATTGSTFKFRKWDDGNTDATRTVTVNADVTYIPYFEVGVEYVEIAGLKWATQNLAITDSGKKTWKKFTNANDDDIFVNGDYFQWAAYAGYCGNNTDDDKGLLIYESFKSKACGDTEDKFTFKSAGEGKVYRFNTSNSGTNIGKSPHYEGSAYKKYQGTGDGKDGKTTLEPSDDVAIIILNKEPDDKWRMPTTDECKEMYNATTWVWDPTDGGYYVFANSEDTSKKYNALLFFPAAGYGYSSDFSFVGRYGYYWSSSLSSSVTDDAYDLYFSSSFVNPQYSYGRNGGRSVRPVSD